MEQRKSTKDEKGKTQEGQTPLRSNTNDFVDGGSNRSSEETPVMGGERRVGPGPLLWGGPADRARA